MEDGGRHFPWSFSGRDDFESDPRPGDSALAVHPQQRCLQRVRCSNSDLGGDASDHACSSWLVARQMNPNGTINWPICVPNPNGTASQSPGLRGTSYPGFIVGEVSNPNGVVSFGSRRCATTLFGLNTQSDHVPRVVASLQPWALLRSPFGANRGSTRSVSTPTPS